MGLYKPTLVGGDNIVKEGIDFYFGSNQGSNNGFRSSEYGIMNVVIDTSKFSEHFLPPARIRETVVRNNPKPHFHGVDFQPVELNLTFFFQDFDAGYTGNDRKKALRELSYWLTRPYYVPFGIIGQEYMYYVVPSGTSNLTHDGIQGYVDITLRTDAPWAYSEIKSQRWDGLDPNKDTLINFENHGDLDIEPEVWIEMPFKSGGTALEASITKTMGNYEVFKFDNLLSQEKVYVHNEKKYIESLNTEHYRYDNFNKRYLKLPRGTTELRVRGIASVVMKYQEKRYIV